MIDDIIDGIRVRGDRDLQEYLLQLYEEGGLTDPILHEMMSRNLWLDYLAHLPLKNDILFELYQMDHNLCAEAAYTLIDYALSEECTYDEFYGIFKKCCGDNVCNYFLETILQYDCINDRLYQKFFTAINLMKDTFNEGTEIFAKALRIENYLKILLLDDEDKFSEFYKQNDPVYFLAMSKNIHTPNELLAELTKIGKIKYAKLIRNNARKLLSKKKR